MCYTYLMNIGILFSLQIDLNFFFFLDSTTLKWLRMDALLFTHVFSHKPQKIEFRRKFVQVQVKTMEKS